MELEASLGASSMEEIIDYLKKNLRRVAETTFSETLVQELSSLFKLQYQQVDRLTSMDVFLAKDQEKAALCADRTYESLTDLTEVMAFTDDATKAMVGEQVRTLLTQWATDDVLRTFTESKLRSALDDSVSDHLASYTESVTRPGADCRKSLLQLLEEVSAEMTTMIKSAWFEDIQEHQAVSGFQTRMKAIENAIRAKEKKEEPVRHTLDDLPPAPKVNEVTPEQLMKPSTNTHIDLPSPPQIVPKPIQTPAVREVEVARVSLPEPPKNIIFKIPSKSARQPVAVME